VTTCFFVTLTTFGESVHKFSLRASGALIGGVLAGLSLVFVLPMMTDIGQLCVLIAAVSLLAAWIATASETISYAGMQIAFAFFLGVLQGYGPAGDLTELRDRVVGILVGNAWVTLIFTMVWPVSSASEIRDIRASLLQLLATLIDADGATSTAEKISVARKLNQIILLRAREVFEWRAVDASGGRISSVQVSERIASHALVLLRARDVSAVAQRHGHADQRIAEQLRALATDECSVFIRVTYDSLAPELLNRARQNLEEEVEHARRSP
jgi:multidrug resistance protein MdtO